MRGPHVDALRGPHASQPLPTRAPSCDHPRVVTPAYDPLREGARLLDRYVLAGPREDRGLGQAWRAHDAFADGAERLIKFHPLAASAEPDAVALVARLRDASAPGVATVLAGGAWQGRLFLVHDTCAGRSLRHWIEGWRTTQTPPTPMTAKMLFLHLCSVMHEAHGKDLAHERLTPASVVVTSVKAPRPLVIFDAGVAQFLSGEDQAACTDYLGPEAFDRPRKGVPVDARRADLFALGVILAELLTLRATPREGTRETWEQLARANPRKPLTSLVARPDDVHPELWSLVDRLLLQRNDPEIATPSKLRQAARKAWEAAGVRDESPESFREAPQPIERPSHVARVHADAERTTAPSREPAASSASQPQQPARAAVVQVYSVEVPQHAPRVQHSEGPSSALTPSPAVARVTPSPPQPLESSLAGDTLVDAGDGHLAALAAAQAVRASPPAPARPSMPRTGGETLLVSDLPDGYGALGHAGATASTLVVDARSRNVVGVVAPAIDPSDPFASYAKKGSGTLALEEALVHAGNPILPSAQHTTIAVDAASRLGASGSHPGAGNIATGNTLPIDSHGLAMSEAVRGSAPSAVAHNVAPRASVPAAGRPPASSSALGARSVLLVVFAGIAVGAVIVLLLRVL